MPFDAGFPTETPAAAERAVQAAALIEAVGDPDPAWAASNPDRMLAFLFVAPRDCAAVDALLAA